MYIGSLFSYVIVDLEYGSRIHKTLDAQLDLLIIRFRVVLIDERNPLIIELVYIIEQIVILSACGRQFNGSGRANEELRPQLVFKRRYIAAHRLLRHVKSLCRFRVTEFFGQGKKGFNFSRILKQGNNLRSADRRRILTARIVRFLQFRQDDFTF
jgi:hypothetical protein